MSKIRVKFELKLTEPNENIDTDLLTKFENEIWKNHTLRGKQSCQHPSVDLTDDLKECSKTIYKLDISDLNLKVFGKFDANLLSGSIKVRPAIHIMHDAIKTGKAEKWSNNH